MSKRQLKPKTVLCSISTRGRYYTTLPMAIQSVVSQTLSPNKLIIYDDTDPPEDVRYHQIFGQTYRYFMDMMNEKGIEFEWVWSGKKGQHFNHQLANYAGYKWVWRLDDDCVAEPNVLQTLYDLAAAWDGVGAVGGSVITPTGAPAAFINPAAHINPPAYINPTGKIERINDEPNIQWGYLQGTAPVDHLHCSFLYRAGVHDYNLSLSRVAHREETLFTYGLKQRGYKLWVTPCVTWHLRSQFGGIRDGQREMFEHDESIFQKRDTSIVILDNGIGDHIVASEVLLDIQNPIVHSCYNDIVPGRSIAEAMNTYGDLVHWNVYVKMDQWRWKDSLENAFRKLYNAPRLKERSKLLTNNLDSNMVIVAPFAQKLRGDKAHLPNPKNYPVPYWKELIHLIAEKGYHVVQIGVEGEEQLTDDFRKLPLSEVPALVNECRTWVSVDSFFQHMCWKLNNRGVALFSQSDPVIFGHEENINLLGDKKYLREKQCWWWEQTDYKTEAFVTPDVVMGALHEILDPVHAALSSRRH